MTETTTSSAFCKNSLYTKIIQCSLKRVYLWIFGAELVSRLTSPLAGGAILGYCNCIQIKCVCHSFLSPITHVYPLYPLWIKAPNRKMVYIQCTLCVFDRVKVFWQPEWWREMDRVFYYLHWDWKTKHIRDVMDVQRHPLVFCGTYVPTRRAGH